MNQEIIGICRNCGGNMVRLNHSSESGRPNMFAECLTCGIECLASDSNLIRQKDPSLPREQLFGQQEPKKIDISALTAGE